MIDWYSKMVIFEFQFRSAQDLFRSWQKSKDVDNGFRGSKGAKRKEWWSQHQQAKKKTKKHDDWDDWSWEPPETNPIFKDWIEWPDYGPGGYGGTSSSSNSGGRWRWAWVSG